MNKTTHFNTVITGLNRILMLIGTILTALLFASSSHAQGTTTVGGAVSRYLDPSLQTNLYFGARSHWIQPWRAYSDTFPTTRLRDAVGINLNVPPAQAEAVCHHLAKNGFRHVRLDYGWCNVSWNNPTKLADASGFDTVVGACKRNGLRPLFLLDGHSGGPCPVLNFSLHLMQAAPQGALTVQINPNDVGLVTPGRTGLSNFTDYWAAEDLIVSITPQGLATLSKPLPKPLSVGAAAAATLKFFPFYPAKVPNGSPCTQFEETMTGWLGYVQAITTEAKRVLGTEGAADAGFDVEVWNELTFGSHFLDINDYYHIPIAPGPTPLSDILARTVSYVLNPASDLAGVGVSDGFNNQWPWGCGSTSPPGLTALGKHPYPPLLNFPSRAMTNRPFDALGRPDGTPIPPDQWQDTFVPTYVSYFPEYYLCAIQTETLIRDLSPIPTIIYGNLHGRNTHPVWPNGQPAPAPQMWVTEVNLDPSATGLGVPAPGTIAVAPAFSPADAEHFRAKATLRYLVSFVNKGTNRLYFYAACDSNPMGFGLVSNAFLDDIQANGNVYPADDTALTSPTMLAVGRLTAAMPATSTISSPRAISLSSVSESHGHMQFAGDPQTAGRHPDPHPPLYNRDVLAFFPFQDSDSKFVVATYVMTRSLGQLYHPSAPVTDITRFDLPPERYRLTIKGIRGPNARVSLLDPMTGQSSPAQVVGVSYNLLTVDVLLTDSPRLLTIEDGLTATASRLLLR